MFSRCASPLRRATRLPGLALALLVSALAWTPAPDLDASQPPASLVRDIAATEQIGEPRPPQYSETVELGGKLYFAQNDGIHGLELWVSDGTGVGTEMVVDLCPGICPGWASSLTVVDDRLFFLGDDGVHGRELFVSDGTAEGTHLVVDAWEGPQNGDPAELTAWGDRLVYRARTGVDDFELWFSDGTFSGTSSIEIRPGSPGSNPETFTVLDDGVFFLASDGVHGQEPWWSDGTPSGTRMIRDVRPGGDGSMHRGSLVVTRLKTAALGDLVVFSADDGIHGQEPWVTDGTEAETRLLADLYADSSDSSPYNFVTIGEDAYFIARPAASRDQVFRTGGVSVEQVSHFPEGHHVASIMGTLGDQLLLSSSTPETGYEPTLLDPLTGDTLLLADSRPGSEGGTQRTFFFGAWPVGERRLFLADDGMHGIEPWITDGTPEGTYLLVDANPGKPGQLKVFDLRLPGELGSGLLLQLQDEQGHNLWRTDGTPATTQRIRDIDLQASSVPWGFLQHYPVMAAHGDGVVAVWRDASHGEEPWVSRGTPGSTRLLGDLVSSDYSYESYPQEIVSSGDHVFLRSRDSTDADVLWVSDGVAEPQQIGTQEDVLSLVAAQDGVFFAATGDNGQELWRSDGTETGTLEVADIRPGPEGSSPHGFAHAFGSHFFWATDDTHGRSLWKTDGTGPGTVLAADLPAGTTPDYQSSLIAAGDGLFFIADAPATGQELWFSDGTDSGTGLVADLLPGPESGLVRLLVFGIGDLEPLSATPDGVFFVGNDGSAGAELWFSDGSEAGTRRVKDVWPGADGSFPMSLTAVGGLTFFSADDGATGRELWVTDGTEAGTRQVIDLEPGPGSSRPIWLTEVDGELYFSAFRSDLGVELWRSDGTAAGTELVTDVAAGPRSSTPELPVASGRRLFFTANDWTHGYEPWSLLLPGRLPRLRLTYSGEATPGGVVTLLVVLYNPPPATLEDGDGDELTLPLPAGFQVLEVLADRGATGTTDAALTVRPDPARRVGAMDADGPVVTWNGALGPDEAVTLTVEVRLPWTDPPAHGYTLSAETSFDTDGDGVSDTSLPSDDPDTPEAEDGTIIQFLPATSIPVGGSWQWALLVLLLGVAALRRLA